MSTEYVSPDGMRKIIVERDPMPQNPRTESPNITKMVLFCRKMQIGDIQDDYKERDFNSMDELQAMIVEREKPLVIHLVYMYDHGIVSLSTSYKYPYNCQWDSTIVGYIYVPDSCKELTGTQDNRIKQAQAAIDDDIETYNKYLAGDVFTYTCLRRDKCLACGNENWAQENFCCGFYGSDPKKSGMSDNILIEYEDCFAQEPKEIK
jgi:hypothetical protein